MPKKKKYGLLISANEWAAIAALGTMTAIVLGAVILRYFFSFTIRWTGELTRFVFIYLVFLGIPMAYREKSHVMIEFFVSFLPAGLRKWLAKGVELAVAACVAVVTVSGTMVICTRLGKTLTPGLKLPRGYVYAAVPIGFTLLLIEIVRRLIKGDKP